MRLYYPFEIEILQTARDETYIDKPYDPAVIALSRRAMEHPEMGRTNTYSVDEVAVTLLCREIDGVTRDDAIRALRDADDDIYQAAMNLVS